MPVKRRRFLAPLEKSEGMLEHLPYPAVEGLYYTRYNADTVGPSPVCLCCRSPFTILSVYYTPRVIVRRGARAPPGSGSRRDGPGKQTNRIEEFEFVCDVEN